MKQVGLSLILVCGALLVAGGCRDERIPGKASAVPASWRAVEVGTVTFRFPRDRKLDGHDNLCGVGSAPPDDCVLFDEGPVLTPSVRNVHPEDQRQLWGHWPRADAARVARPHQRAHGAPLFVGRGRDHLRSHGKQRRTRLRSPSLASADRRPAMDALLVASRLPSSRADRGIGQVQVCCRSMPGDGSGPALDGAEDRKTASSARKPVPRPVTRNKMLALAFTALLMVLAGLWLRPPGPGKVYRHGEVDLGGATSTMILLKRQDCFTLSYSSEDIGSTETGLGTIGRTYAVAAAGSVSSGQDARGLYLVDKATGQKARPGDGVDGEILRMRHASPLKMFLSLGWVYDRRCGNGVALIRSIDRAHD